MCDELKKVVENEYVRLNKEGLCKGMLNQIHFFNKDSSSENFVVLALRKSYQYIYDSTTLLPDYSLKSKRPWRVPGFVGCEDELDEITEKFKESNCVFITGMGGIGKTTLAMEYLARHSSEYDIVITVTFENNIKNTIIKIDCKGIPQKMESDEQYETICELLNDDEQDVIVLIDNLTCGSHNENDYVNELRKFKCCFLVTTRCEIDSAINLDEIDDDNLCVLFLNQIKKRTEEILLLQNNMVDIIRLLHRNTLLVEISGKVFDSIKLTLNEFMKTILGDDPQYDKQKVTHKRQTRTTEDFLKSLFSIAFLTEQQYIILMDFSLLPEGEKIGTDNAERWYNPFSRSDFAVLHDLGWLQRDVNEDKWGIHPLIASTIRKYPAFSNCPFKNELRNIESFAYLYFQVGSGYLANCLYSTVSKVRVDSDALMTCKSRVCIWLCTNGRRDLAYDLYCKTGDKSGFLPEVYDYLEEYAAVDPELTNNIAKIRNEHDKVRREKEELLENIMSSSGQKRYLITVFKDPAIKLNYGDKYLRTLILTLNGRLSELKFDAVLKPAYILRAYIYSYRSAYAFKNLPVDVKRKSYLEFLKKQIAFHRIEDTDIYKSVKEVLGSQAEEINLSFYNDINAMRYMLISAAHIECISEIIRIYSQGRIYTQEGQNTVNYLLTEHKELFDKNYMYLNYQTRMQWDIHLGYCCCLLRDYQEVDRIISGYEKQDNSVLFRQRVELKILVFFKECMIKINNPGVVGNSNFVDDLTNKLKERCKVIMNFFRIRNKAIAERGANVPTLFLTALRAMSLLFDVYSDTFLCSKAKPLFSESVSRLKNTIEALEHSTMTANSSLTNDDITTIGGYIDKLF